MDGEAHWQLMTPCTQDCSQFLSYQFPRFLCSDAGGSIQLHYFDFTKLTKYDLPTSFKQFIFPRYETPACCRKITQGKYEDKEEPHRSFEGHTFGVYMVRWEETLDKRGTPALHLNEPTWIIDGFDELIFCHIFGFYTA